MSSDTALIEGCDWESKLRQDCCNFSFLLAVKLTVMRTELSTNPKNSIVWEGVKTDFSSCTQSPKFVNKLDVTVTFCLHSS